MRRRLAILVGFGLAVGAACPVVVHAGDSDSQDLKLFLKQRNQVLDLLHRNSEKLPKGLAHKTRLPKRDPLLPGDDHIRQVVGGSRPWVNSQQAAFELSVSDELLEARKILGVAMLVANHFSNGLAGSGLSTRGGGLSGVYGSRRATQTQLWSHADGHFTVAFSVVVDAKSNAAHVHRFVIERFE